MSTPLTKIPARHADLTGNLPDAALPPGMVYDRTALRMRHVGQAAATGGDRWSVQTSANADLVKVDANGTVVHDLAANTSNIARTILPASHSTADNVPWNEGTSSESNGDGTFNQVYSAGHNITANGAQLDPTKTSVRFACEQSWLNPAGPIRQSEAHWFCVTVVEAGPSEIRVLTASCTHEASPKIAMVITASSFSHLTEAGTPYAQLSTNGTDSLSDTLSIGGIAGSSILLSSTSDVIQFGRAATTTSQLGVQGKNAQLEVRNDTVTWSQAAPSGDWNYYLELNGYAAYQFLGTAGSVGEISLIGQSASMVGMLFSTNGKSGYALFNAGGDYLLVPEVVAGKLYLGGSFTSYIAPGGSLVLGSGTAVTKFLQATATLDFPSTNSGSSSDLTIALTGATLGDPVTVGTPATWAAGTFFYAFVSSSNTVTVRFDNRSGSAVDPASGTYKVQIRQ